MNKQKEIENNYKKEDSPLTDKKLVKCYKVVYSDNTGEGFLEYIGVDYGGCNSWDSTEIILPDSYTKIKCCDSPDIIKNEAGGEQFYVCKNCKNEVDKFGFKNNEGK